MLYVVGTSPYMIAYLHRDRSAFLTRNLMVYETLNFSEV